MLGYRIGYAPGSRLIVGAELGAGFGPERLNIGVTRRLNTSFAYIEIDPWYLVGASLGVGVDEDGEAHPIIGLWEGLPIMYPTCDYSDPDLEPVLTLSIGYRYTGVHEIYLAPKVGAGSQGQFCPRWLVKAREAPPEAGITTICRSSSSVFSAATHRLSRDQHG